MRVVQQSAANDAVNQQLCAHTGAVDRLLAAAFDYDGVAEAAAQSLRLLLVPGLVLVLSARHSCKRHTQTDRQIAGGQPQPWQGRLISLPRDAGCPH